MLKSHFRQIPMMFIVLYVRIRQQDAVFELFRLYSLPIPIHPSTTNSTLLKKLPDYLAVSADRSIYIELSAGDVQLWRGERMLMTIYVACLRAFV